MTTTYTIILCPTHLLACQPPYNIELRLPLHLSHLLPVLFRLNWMSRSQTRRAGSQLRRQKPRRKQLERKNRCALIYILFHTSNCFRQIIAPHHDTLGLGLRLLFSHFRTQTSLSCSSSQSSLVLGALSAFIVSASFSRCCGYLSCMFSCCNPLSVMIS
jgi:hypothetical protein